MAKQSSVKSLTEALAYVGPTAFGSSADYAAFQAALEGEDVDEAVAAAQPTAEGIAANVDQQDRARAEATDSEASKGSKK